ncbi:ABC transporter ATP-binding protein [Crocinitomix catalasitica]|uniref:ABC transporter ATP-binding protein n=1 Tax=Crocinitomix catalasitica TaxID=184607 RepID=UPI0004822FFC|nr:ABC transporter ATP-binding protein [Crocinitomix catalasitica]
MSSLFYLNKYLVRYKWRLILGVIFIIISNIFSVEMPVIVRVTINEIFAQVESGETDTFSNLLKLGLKAGGLYMLFSLLKGFFLFLTRQTIIVMSRYIEFDLKNEIYTHYQKLSFKFYKKNSTGDLMNRISEDVSRVRMYLGPGIMYTINLFFLFALVLYQMLKTNTTLTVYVLMPLPIMSVLIYYVSRILNKKSEKVQRQQSLLTTIVQESFSGIRVIKAHIKENSVEGKFNKAANDYKDNNMSLATTNAFFMPTITLLIGVSTILTIYVGGIQAYHGEIDPGEIAEFVIYVNMLTWPFASVGWVTSIVQHAAASQTRINEFLENDPEIITDIGRDIEFEESITFNDVNLTFENTGHHALKNLSFTINKGETVGVIGRTGSGKSSLAYLLMRLLDPNSGEILIDNIPLTDIKLDSWRKIIGYVPQEHFLFSDTIKNNINFGVNSTQVNEETMRSAANNAGILETIEKFPAGFDTILGERGINLSGGQKQRLSIARALIKKPSLLILDDCLSAVDNETEEYILDAIKNDLANNTAVIISHRISSLKYADKILVFDDGVIIESGTHDSLLDLKGAYYDIYKRQEIQADNLNEN